MSCFLLASAPLVALIVRLIASGVAMPIAPAITVSWATPLSAGSVSAAPLVSGAVVAGCLAVAAGYGLQAALRRAGRWSGSGALDRVLGQADRGGTAVRTCESRRGHPEGGWRARLLSIAVLLSSSRLK